MNSRTVRDFTVPTDIWPIVARWAAGDNFDLKSDEGSKKRYENSTSPVTVVEISQEDLNIHLEAWTKASVFSRLISLFTLPEELSLDSTETKAVVPRAIARDSVNRLMIQLAQPLIK